MAGPEPQQRHVREILRFVFAYVGHIHYRRPRQGGHSRDEQSATSNIAEALYEVFREASAAELHQ